MTPILKLYRYCDAKMFWCELRGKSSLESESVCVCILTEPHGFDAYIFAISFHLIAISHAAVFVFMKQSQWRTWISTATSRINGIVCLCFAYRINRKYAVISNVKRASYVNNNNDHLTQSIKCKSNYEQVIIIFLKQ